MLPILCLKLPVWRPVRSSLPYLFDRELLPACTSRTLFRLPPFAPLGGFVSSWPPRPLQPPFLAAKLALRPRVACAPRRRLPNSLSASFDVWCAWARRSRSLAPPERVPPFFSSGSLQYPPLTDLRGCSVFPLFTHAVPVFSPLLQSFLLPLALFFPLYLAPLFTVCPYALEYHHSFASALRRISWLPSFHSLSLTEVALPHHPRPLTVAL